MIRAIALAGAASLSVAQALAAPAQCTPEHAAMGHCTMPPAEPAAPAAIAPAITEADAADAIWDAEAMARARAAMHREHGGGTFSKVTIDLAEITFGRDHEGYRWEADAWFGGDIHRLALKTEGEGEWGGSFEDVELTALYSRAIGPYFNLQAGVRHDIRPDPSRTYAVAGVEGLAPFWFEVGGYLYLSHRGEVRGRLTAEYDQRVTQRLILQPKVEFDLAAQDMPDIGIGAGLSSAEIGLRLRYEITREFAPYVGLVHDAKVGSTADYARAGGEDAASTTFVAGVRFWF